MSTSLNPGAKRRGKTNEARSASGIIPEAKRSGIYARLAVGNYPAQAGFNILDFFHKKSPIFIQIGLFYKFILEIIT
jgi:hypothetical protein